MNGSAIDRSGTESEAYSSSEPSVSFYQQSGLHRTWREAVECSIDDVGWRRFTRVDQPDRDVTIYTVDVAAPRASKFRAEGPPTFSLSVCLCGSGTFAIDGALPLAVKPGLGVLFASNRYTLGENTVKATERFHVIDVRFEKRFLVKAGGAPLAQLGCDLLSDHSLPDRGLFLVGFPAPPPLLQAARCIAGCRIAEGTARKLYLYSKAIECLSLVIHSFSLPSPQRPALRGEDYRRVQHAREIVETQYDVDWTIARLAREVGVNERKLKEGFREIVGNSVHAHLRDIRIEAAAALLDEGKTVTEAALAVGFSNLSHFSKTFSAKKGMLPSRYRR
ncbi:helix-turn-helix transcriptional regulator [Rhodomicrobium sp. Az07]|uniref:helix-turn-helix transcriptional regulator n=1 Tax=Rhodomicrobium sp. Az07 TaxID=2839034 RepID=UPI003530295B